MTIRHHISDPLLMAYSAGTLPEAFSLVVATHISMCDECRARLMSFDAIGGALIEDEAAPLDDAAVDAMMARITGCRRTRARSSGPPGQERAARAAARLCRRRSGGT